MNENDKIELDIDWDELFPGETIPVGDTGRVINIEPLKFGQIASLMRKAKVIIPDVVSMGVTKKNYADPDMIMGIVATLMERSPELMSDLSGIAMKSMVKIPLPFAIEVFTAVVKVNMNSWEALEKNFESLMALIDKLIPDGEKEETAAEAGSDSET